MAKGSSLADQARAQMAALAGPVKMALRGDRTSLRKWRDYRDATADAVTILRRQP